MILVYSMAADIIFMPYTTVQYYEFEYLQICRLTLKYCISSKRSSEKFGSKTKQI